ncbi:MAG TPA: nucleoside-diphosphate sugar epimerase/dehydratase [Pyrinomonadaceae bacterium]|nr:nucleoside-diphosphate sugar epimerase/dehydratase [Pyrinomonadaceae bacterium]
MDNLHQENEFARQRLWFMRRPVQLILDLLVLAAAFLFAYLLRFDFQIPRYFLENALDQLPFVVLVQFLTLFLVGGYALIWRYISIEDVKFFLRAALTSALILLLIRFLLPPSFERWQVPVSITLMTTVFGFGSVFGLRMLRRWVYELYERRQNGGVFRKKSAKRKSALFVGAGRMGAIAVKEISRREESGLDIKGFVDDDRQKRGGSVNGVKVLGTTEDLPRLVEEMQISQVILALDRTSGKDVRRVTEICQRIGVKTRIVPSLHEIVDGRVRLERIRDVQIEDLLGREPVELDDKGIGAFLTGKTVMVTGAGGSIGAELVRQVAAFEPGTLLLVERAEFNLFEIDRELRQTFPDLNRVSLIADIADAPRMRDIFDRFRPAVIFHAAAHKHVPLMEQNPCEAIKNNVFATRLIGELAGQSGAEAFVFISTDKAVNPTSVMGASKRVAELVVQSLNQQYSATRYMGVRFGNVLGSAGSVVPIFREQIRKGDPITITHPDMTRYFMTIPEAAQLVLQAGAIGHGGEIFILDMGEPVRIVQLAEDLIRLSGLQPYEDVDIVFTGIRQGEKLFEELETDGEDLMKTRHPKIYIGKIAAYAPNQVSEMMARFAESVEKAAPEEVRSLFNEFLPEAKIELKSQSSPKVVSGSANSNGKTNLLRDSDDNAATAFAS